MSTSNQARRAAAAAAPAVEIPAKQPKKNSDFVFAVKFLTAAALTIAVFWAMNEAFR